MRVCALATITYAGLGGSNFEQEQGRGDEEATAHPRNGLDGSLSRQPQKKSTISCTPTIHYLITVIRAVGMESAVPVTSPRTFHAST
jgi:hypothetical protein